MASILRSILGVFWAPQNHEKSYWRLGENRIFIKSPISFWDPIWDPPGLPFGRGFGPQDCRKRSPGCPWAVQEPIAGPSKLRKTISRAPMGRPRADRRNLLFLQEPSMALHGPNQDARDPPFYRLQDGSILEIRKSTILDPKMVDFREPNCYLF